MTGAGGVVALVLIEWATGWLGAAAWTQSWKVVRRGHFRVTAWVVAVVAVLALLAGRNALQGVSEAGLQLALLAALAACSVIFLIVQYSNTDLPGVVVGAAGTIAGVACLVTTAALLDGWPAPLAALCLVAGAALMGGIWNGMMLGHWYLNQPGLKTWALARLTNFTLVGAVLVALTGIVAAPRLTSASTEGAVLGIPGFGQDFSMVFFIVWLCTLGLTGAVVWGARRCVQIKSIQSATGLFYVAVLAGGVSEFLVRYLMINA